MRIIGRLSRTRVCMCVCMCSTSVARDRFLLRARKSRSRSRRQANRPFGPIDHERSRVYETTFARSRVCILYIYTYQCRFAFFLFLSLLARRCTTSECVQGRRRSMNIEACITRERAIVDAPFDILTQGRPLANKNLYLRGPAAATTH